MREVLNRARWDRCRAPGAVVLTVLARDGGVERSHEVDFASVVDILPGGVTVADGTFLPYHRIVAVRRGEELLWDRGPR